MQNSSPTQLTQIFNVLNDNNQMMEDPHKGSYMAEDELTPCVIFQTVVQNDTANRDDENTNPSSLIVNEHADLSPCATTEQPYTTTHDHYSLDQNQVSSVQPVVVPSPTVTRKSSKHAKLLIWHTDYVLTKQKTRSGNCSYSIANVVYYHNISPAYRSY
ncbi:hypothetical protein H5410_018454, partial [Solanum commersonii]